MCGIRKSKEQVIFTPKRTAQVFKAGKGKMPAAKKIQLLKKRSVPKSTPICASKRIPQNDRTKREANKKIPTGKEARTRTLRYNTFTD